MLLSSRKHRGEASAEWKRSDATAVIDAPLLVPSSLSPHCSPCGTEPKRLSQISFSLGLANEEPYEEFKEGIEIVWVFIPWTSSLNGQLRHAASLHWRSLLFFMSWWSEHDCFSQVLQRPEPIGMYCMYIYMYYIYIFYICEWEKTEKDFKELAHMMWRLVSLRSAGLWASWTPSEALMLHPYIWRPSGDRFPSSSQDGHFSLKTLLIGRSLFTLWRVICFTHSLLI